MRRPVEPAPRNRTWGEHVEIDAIDPNDYRWADHHLAHVWVLSRRQPASDFSMLRGNISRFRDGELLADRWGLFDWLRNNCA